MYRPPDIDNFNDFWTYYRGRWLGLPAAVLAGQIAGIAPGAIVPVRPDDAAGNNEGARANPNIYLRCVTNAEGNVAQGVLPYADLLQAGLFGKPQIGMLQYGPTAAFCSRGSPRVAHRGLTTPKGRELFLINGFSSRGSEPGEYPLVWQCFNSAFIPLGLASNMVQTGARVAVAVARDWAISSGNAKEEQFLWFRTNPVAEIKGRDITFMKEFQEEAMLLDFEEFFTTSQFRVRA